MARATGAGAASLPGAPSVAWATSTMEAMLGGLPAVVVQGFEARRRGGLRRKVGRVRRFVSSRHRRQVSNIRRCWRPALFPPDPAVLGSTRGNNANDNWSSPRQIVVRGQQWNRGIQAGPAPVFRPNSARLIGVLNAKHQVDWQMLIGSGSLRVSANRIPSAPAAQVDFLVHQFRQRPIRERLNGVSTSSHKGARTRRRSRRSQRRSWRARPRRCPRRRAVTDWPARWVEETDEPAGRFPLRLGLSVR